MKTLTTQQFISAPSLVQFVYLNTLNGIPIGTSVYDEVLADYPEYFPEEVQQKRKWAAVPDDVKDAYFKEVRELWSENTSELPSKGFLYWARHPEEYRQWQSEWDKLRPERERKEKALHDKYLSKYGIPYQKS